MGLATEVFFIVLVSATASNAFLKLSPVGKEIVYNYNAAVNLGTHFPQNAASVFHLSGKVHIQGGNNATHVQLTDLELKLYNGKLDYEHELQAQAIPLPSEAGVLQKTFKIVYDQDGTIMGIGTGEEEKEWSRNIKRALGAIIQLHVKSIETTHHPIAFTTDENSIYGFGQVNYDVVPLHNDDNAVEIHKYHNMKTSHHLYQHATLNLVHMSQNDKLHDGPLNHYSHRHYFIVNHDGHQIVKRIEAVGGLTYTPYNSKSDVQYLVANQTLELLEVKPITEQLQVSNEHYNSELTYHYYDHEETGSILDVTNGRSSIKNDEVVQEVVKMVQESWQYLQEDHIHTKIPNVARGQMINRIVYQLLHLKLKELQQIHDLLKSDIKHLEIFVKILPLVGTKATVLQIKNLVMEKIISSEIGQELLLTFPHYVAVPSQDLLKEMEPLLNLNDDYGWSVQKAGILSFATLIHKSIQWYSTLAHESRIKPIRHQDYVPYYGDTQKEVDSYVKYVEEVGEKWKNSKDAKIRSVLLMALRNMQHPHVYDVLAPHLMGEIPIDHNDKFMALVAILPLVVGNHEYLHKIIWPLLVDPLEYSEIRIVAYRTIMVSEPEISTLNSIYWLMMHESDVELYHFHYSYFHTLANSIDPTQIELKNLAAKLLRYMHPAVHGFSTVHFHDFQNWDFGFGGSWQTGFLTSNVSQVIAIRQTLNHLDMNEEVQCIIIRVSGLTNQIMTQDVFSQLVSQKLSSGLVQTDKRFQMDILYMKHDHVHSVYHIDRSNILEVSDLLKFIVHEEPSILIPNQKFINIDYMKYERALIPTDFGTPAMWEFLMPTVEYGKGGFSLMKKVKEKIIGKIDMNYNAWTHYSHGLVSYNPLADIWQGINRIHSHDRVLPLNYQIDLSISKPSMKLTWKKNSEASKNIMGLRSHVMTYVFAFDINNKNLLTKSSPSSQQWMVVSNGEKYRDDYVLMDEDCLAMGHQMKASIYDSEHHVSNGSVQQVLHQMERSHTKHESPIWNYWLYLSHLYTYGLVMPLPGVHGVMMRVEPSVEHDVNSIELSLKAFPSSQTPHRYDGPMKLDVDLSYAVKNDEEKLLSTKFNGVISTNLGHDLTNVKMELTHSQQGEDKVYKVCVDGSEEVLDDKIKGHYNIIMSHSTSNGHCDKSGGAKIEIDKLATVSDEQKEKYDLYRSCMQPVPYWVEMTHSPMCLRDLSSVRHYSYVVKTTNVPEEVSNTVVDLWHYILGYWSWHVTEDDEHRVDMHDGDVRIDVIYPVLGDDVDIHVSTPQQMYNLTGLPSEDLKWWGMWPESLVYDDLFLWVHKLPYVDICEIHPDHFQLSHNYFVLYDHTPLPNDWTVYYSHHHQKLSDIHTVYVKKVLKNLIAVKITLESNVLEIIPEEDGKLPHISLNGQISTNPVYNSDWIYYHQLVNENHNTMILWLPQLGLQIDYFGHRVVLSAPKVKPDSIVTGQCVKV